MAPKDKLLDQAKRNPKSLHFADFESLLRQCNWIFDRQRGSHRIWYSPTRFRISIQKRGYMAKGYQVEQFLKQYEEETGRGQ